MNKLTKLLNKKYKKVNNKSEIINQLSGFIQPITLLELSKDQIENSRGFINYSDIKLDIESLMISLTKCDITYNHKLKSIENGKNILILRTYIDFIEKKEYLLEIRIIHDLEHLIYNVELEMFDRNRQYSYEIRYMYI